MTSKQQSRRLARELFRLCLREDSLDEQTTRRVVDRVAALGRRNAKAVLTHFLRLVKVTQAQHTAGIETAESGVRAGNRRGQNLSIAILTGRILNY